MLSLVQTFKPFSLHGYSLEQDNYWKLFLKNGKLLLKYITFKLAPNNRSIHKTGSKYPTEARSWWLPKILDTGNAEHLNKKFVFWKVFTQIYNQTLRNSSWCFEEQLEMVQNEDLGESSEHFQFPCSRYQQKFKLYCGTLQHMQFWKENHTSDKGEGTGTIISTEPSNEIKYWEKIDNACNELVH